MTNLLTNSGMTTLRACPRKYQLAYVIGLRRDEEHKALTLGKAFHAAADHYERTGDIAASVNVATDMYAVVPEWVSDLSAWNEQRVVVQCLITSYFIRYADSPLVTMESELAFEMPLPSPDAKYTKSGRPDRRNESKTVRKAGKIDRIVKLPDGRLAVLETKTTGESINDGAEYWERLRLDSQISYYVHAARALGYDVSTVLYDVIHKPGIALAKATPVDKRKYKKDGTLYANMRDQDESLDEYAERLMTDIASRPDFYFARREIARTDADLAAAQREWWDWASILRENRAQDRWPKNPSSCFAMGRCQYHEVCATGMDVTKNVPMGFRIVDDVNPELQMETKLNDNLTSAANGNDPTAAPAVELISAARRAETNAAAQRSGDDRAKTDEYDNECAADDQREDVQVRPD